jgi:hypothetical protein
MTQRAAAAGRERRTTVARVVLLIVGGLNLLPGVGLLGPERPRPPRSPASRRSTWSRCRCSSSGWR